MASCIDVSAPINFSAFAADGGVVAIIKCTESLNFVNPVFAQMKADALVAGLAVASYHFLHADNAAAQAQWYLSRLNPAQGERVICDAEEFGGPTLDDIVGFVEALVRLRPDLRVTIYGDYDYLHRTVGGGRHPVLSLHTDLWIAEWGASAPVTPSLTWPSWTLWQYTGNRRVYNGAADLNRFNGTAAQARAWASAGVPVMDFSTVKGLQSALDTLGYKLTLDGAYGPATGAALAAATNNGTLLQKNG